MVRYRGFDSQLDKAIFFQDTLFKELCSCNHTYDKDSKNEIVYIIFNKDIQSLITDIKRVDLICPKGFCAEIFFGNIPRYTHNNGVIYSLNNRMALSNPSEINDDYIYYMLFFRILDIENFPSDAIIEFLMRIEQL